MTGMPAWGVTHGDDVLWDVVAFLKKLPDLTAEQYQALVESVPKTHELLSPLLTELVCEKCGNRMNLRRGQRGRWLGCSGFPKCKGRLGWTKLDEATRRRLESALEKHERANPPVTLTRLDGTPIPAGTPVTGLIIPRGVAELEIHPSARTA